MDILPYIRNAPFSDYNASKGDDILNLMLLSQYRDKPNFRAYMQAFQEEFNTLFLETEKVYQGRFIENAVGRQLDVIGIILDESRGVNLPTQFFGFQGAPDVASPSFAAEATPQDGGVFRSEGQSSTGNYVLSDIEYRRLLLAKAYTLSLNSCSADNCYYILTTLLGRTPRVMKLITSSALESIEGSLAYGDYLKSDGTAYVPVNITVGSGDVIEFDYVSANSGVFSPLLSAASANNLVFKRSSDLLALSGGISSMVVNGVAIASDELTMVDGVNYHIELTMAFAVTLTELLASLGGSPTAFGTMANFTVNGNEWEYLTAGSVEDQSNGTAIARQTGTVAEFVNDWDNAPTIYNPAWTQIGTTFTCDGSQTGNADFSEAAVYPIGSLIEYRYTITERTAGAVICIAYGGSSVVNVNSTVGDHVVYLPVTSTTTQVGIRGNAAFTGSVTNIQIGLTTKALIPVFNAATNVYTPPIYQVDERQVQLNISQSDTSGSDKSLIEYFSQYLIPLGMGFTVERV